VVEQRYQAYKDQGFQTYLLITENGMGLPADANYCTAIRDMYSLTMPVLYDPGDNFSTIVDYQGHLNDWDFLIGQGGELVFQQKWVDQPDIEEIIQQTLSE